MPSERPSLILRLSFIPLGFLICPFFYHIVVIAISGCYFINVLPGKVKNYQTNVIPFSFFLFSFFSSVTVAWNSNAQGPLPCPSPWVAWTQEVHNRTLDIVVEFCGCCCCCCCFPSSLVELAYVLIYNLYPTYFQKDSRPQDSFSPGIPPDSCNGNWVRWGPFLGADRIQQQGWEDEAWSCAIYCRQSCHTAVWQSSAGKGRDWDQGPLACVPGQPSTVDQQLHLLSPGMWFFRSLSLGCKASPWAILFPSGDGVLLSAPL